MSDESQAIPGYAIGRLRLEPGDVLVVKCHHPRISQEVAEELRRRMRERVGAVPVLVISDDIDLAVLTRAEIDARIDVARQVPERIIDLPVA